MSAWLVLWLALAGGLGAGARYAIDRLFPAREGGFAWGIFLVNVSGSFALGVLTGLGSAAASDLGVILGVGLLGGYTTFSTVSVETVLLVERRRWVDAAGTLFGTLGIAVGAAAMGYALATWIVTLTESS
ncbi:CrcB family protein [Microbacterium marmarense]|uniref:Fluoride-specific ion channel FluC n=1 Tax=Microbacterium marmarense TaxID=3122051 RepID=A0ABU8LQB4_9MICO